MLKIIGVRFKSVGKIYYFDPKDYDVTKLSLRPQGALNVVKLRLWTGK